MLPDMLSSARVIYDTVEVRERLLQKRLRLVFWLIDHHPESELHDHITASTFHMDRNTDRAIIEDANRRWRAQADQHPDDARVLGNAARALLGGDPRVGFDLLRRARKLDPKRWTQGLGEMYALELVTDAEASGAGNPFKDPVLAAEFRNELRDSTDVDLLGAVARFVVTQAALRSLTDSSPSNGTDAAALKALATELVMHLQNLDPQNRDWSDLMEGVNRLPEVRRPLPKPQPASETLPPAIRIGEGVAAARLLEAPALEYPERAKAAQIQGDVKLQIRIGKDGHVVVAELISGHPLLTRPAMDAVSRYVYKPTMLGGKPVDVLTTVTVKFQQ